ncbi:MAG TPA: carboxypeptidase regulatory-like domain-containing protein [Thermoanaerobaculia bacterium]|nr:carboxypeptidase regulatory-like domain-containing protein [Thermoanaerobaculia bacterium]
MRIALPLLVAFCCVDVVAAPSPRRRTHTISGTVIARNSGVPVRGAAITIDDKTVAMTGKAGRFSFEADAERWPEAIAVHAAPFTRTELRVPPARAATNLGEITLSLGGAIDIEVSPDVVEVEILHVEKGRVRGRSVARKAVKEGAVKFEDLAPGDYIVLAKGDQPWERLGEVVHVMQGLIERVRPSIIPFPVAVRARFDGEPLARAEVVLTHKDGHWEEKLALDEAGEASAELWQEGRVTAAVHSTAMTAPWLERRTLSGDDTELRLDIPAREINGTVLDARSGEPIANAALRLKVTGDDGTSLTVGAKSDAEGRFRIAPVAYGQHLLKAAAANHPPVDVAYSFREPEERRSLTLRLDPAATVRVTVTDPRGTPIPGARAMHFQSFGRRLGIARTDATGIVEIPVPDDAPSELYVVPRDGSFGFVQLKTDVEEIPLRISDASCRIVLRAQSDQHAPIPDLSVVVRYNGRVLPPDVLEALRTMQGARTVSDHRGEIVLERMPAGIYEFWPVGTPAELRALASGVGPEAPVRITAAPGENVALLTFAAVP